ncbi:ribonuclease domain-containing protein [Amycolatopsis minnesotensis]|uniref:Ribonuclease domain-containing protein n=1 Tax=Amycolatopsis minnesotensis TaxID=337894 RepID=A0ABN2RY05_9PSEU
MTNQRSRVAGVLLAFVITLLSGLGIATSASASAPAAGAAGAAGTTGAAVAAPSCGDTSSYKKTPLSTLPAEAGQTYDLIKKGGPFPYPGKDGSVFTNKEGILPSCASDYYHEYTVPTPGSPDRGARRIVTGSAGEFFYTGDHYKTFSIIQVDGGTPNPTPKCGDTAGVAKVKLSTLSSAAKSAVEQAKSGAAGTVYENREGVLPKCDAGYYHLFNAGDQDRVISGKGGEIFYTPDHYATFKLVDLGG